MKTITALQTYAIESDNASVFGIIFLQTSLFSPVRLAVNFVLFPIFKPSVQASHTHQGHDDKEDGNKGQEYYFKVVQFFHFTAI